jgi:cell division transport system permease protein
VGATNWFIRGPFLLEGALKGLLGGLLAILLCYAGFAVFQRSAPALSGLVFFTPLHMLFILAFGILLGLLASLISVGRHLRLVGGRPERRAA